MKTKILLQIDACLNNGSTGRINEQIGLLVKKFGWESYIVHSARYKNPTQLKSIQVGCKLQEIWHALSSRLFDNHGLSSTLATKRLICKIRRINPSIIHLHTIHGYYINYQILFEYLKEVNIPIVWTLHDCWNFTGHCAYFAFEGCDKWKRKCNSCPLKSDYPSSLGLFDKSCFHYLLKKELFTSVKNLTLVPVSYWLEDMVNESFFKNYSNIKIYMIYNGVDTSVFKPQIGFAKSNIRKKIGISDTDFMAVACATSWGKRKGLKDYVALSKKVDSAIKLVMVGVNLHIKKSLPDNIIALSRTENIDELAVLYSAADVVLNLSYEETFGLTTVEGFACGTPSIVYNVTASPELVTKETGYIIEKGDIDGVIAAMREISIAGKERYSEACRSRALQFFASKTQFYKYWELYNTLISKD